MKEKICILIILTVSTALKIYAQYDFMHDYGYYTQTLHGPLTYTITDYRFSAPNIIEYKSYTAEYYNYDDKINNIRRTGTYNISENGNVPFIYILWENNTSERYLILVNRDLLCLYNRDHEPVFFGFFREIHILIPGTGEEVYRAQGNIGYYDISATNSLVEGEIDYSPTCERLGLKINSAWAVRGGIGESLFLEDLYSRADIIYISIGYVSYSRPYLYTDNSRPRKIRISNVRNNSNFREYILEDTPNFQAIDISELGINIRIEILEIYRGTKYNDTCINAILPLM